VPFTQRHNGISKKRKIYEYQKSFGDDEKTNFPDYLPKFLTQYKKMDDVEVHNHRKKCIRDKVRLC